MTVEATFSLALYLHSRGLVPKRTLMRDGRPVFVFSDEAEAHVSSFTAACAALNAYARYAEREAKWADS